MRVNALGRAAPFLLFPRLYLIIIFMVPDNKRPLAVLEQRFILILLVICYPQEHTSIRHVDQERGFGRLGKVFIDIGHYWWRASFSPFQTSLHLPF